MAVFSGLMTGVGTDRGALAAPDTLRRRVEDLRRMFPRLRIVTPDTAQRTPFEKYRCPDTRTVMDGKLLNIKNDCFHKKIPSVCFIYTIQPKDVLCHLFSEKKHIIF